MNEDASSFEENELSAEDMAVLRAFEAMDDWPAQPSFSDIISELTPGLKNELLPHYPAQQVAVDFSSEDMHQIFIAEVDEDLRAMRHSLNQLEQEPHIQPARFRMFRRSGHKIRGSAGAVGFHSIAKIAQNIEEIAIQIEGSSIFPVIGARALEYAISAMEMTLQGLIASEEESDTPLTELEKELGDLLVDGASTTSTFSSSSTSEDGFALPLEKYINSSKYMNIDAMRFADLLRHSEQLAELHTPLGSALAQVEGALQELHVAQNHLTQLESKRFALLTTSQFQPLVEDVPTSSLMARILSDAEQRNDTSHHSRHKDKSKNRSYASKSIVSSIWDELDIEHYSEQDLLQNSLREVIAEVNTAASRVRVAFAYLHLVLQEYTSQATTVRNDTLVLRLVPLSILVNRLREVLAASVIQQGSQVQFEVVGDAIEIDQQILEALSIPLIQLLETYSVDTSQAYAQMPARIWLHVQETGNTISIEVGFSAAVSGGAVDPLRETIQRLDGTLSLQRNDTDGVSFHLRLPRSQGAIHCLLIRINDQHVIVPFSQVQRIGDGKQEEFDKLYSLHDLFGCPTKPVFSGRIQPVLVLLQRTSPFSVGVIVDEVIDDVELVVKPLPSYVQRPGIANAAIDGKGRVLLMADLPELIRHYNQLQFNTNDKTDSMPFIKRAQPKILLADDSVALRNTLVQMLKHANYVVLESRDGLEALEQLIQHVPDVFLLDVEMPNLNGYDLLGIMRLYPSLAGVKIIMLTSRSSEKHIQHAMDLGAHAYLTKPCSQETLVETIQKLLRS